jgi:hypothetical protein
MKTNEINEAHNMTYLAYLPYSEFFLKKSSLLPMMGFEKGYTNG